MSSAFLKKISKKANFLKKRAFLLISILNFNKNQLFLLFFVNFITFLVDIFYYTVENSTKFVYIPNQKYRLFLAFLS